MVADDGRGSAGAARWDSGLLTHVSSLLVVDLVPLSLGSFAEIVSLGRSRHPSVSNVFFIKVNLVVRHIFTGHVCLQADQGDQVDAYLVPEE